MTYFEQRAIKIEDDSNKISKEKLKTISDVYESSEKTTIKLLDKLYAKYGINGIVPIESQKQYINSDELKEFKKNINKYIDEIKEIGEEYQYSELIPFLDKVKIKRLESIYMQIKAEQNLLFTKYGNEATDCMSEVYEYSYNQTMYTIQNETSLYYNFALVNNEMLEKVLSYENNGINFSERIWGEHREKLFNDVQKSIAQSMAIGNDYKACIKGISERYNVSMSNATRLMNTEDSFYCNQAVTDSYKEAGVDSYQYLATLDSDTSTICRNLDNKKFKVSDSVVGINYPPMHPNCRSTTIADIGINYKERVMRDTKGKSVTTGYLTYEQWAEKYNVE